LDARNASSGRLERKVDAAAIDHPRGHHHRRIRGVALHGVDDDLALDHLERADRSPKLFAALRVLERLAHDPTRAARRRGRQAEPPRVEDLERDLEAMPHVAKAILDRNDHVVEEDGPCVGGLDAHLLFALAERDSLGMCVDDEGRHALLFRAAGIDRDLREHRE
jgi:hypothetical protein